jgi:type VI secretion system protein ImpL
VKQLFEEIARETLLTKEPEGQEPAAGAQDDPTNAAIDQATQKVTQKIASRAGGLARIGIDLAVKKSQNRAGNAGGGAQIPGANIEAQFREFHNLVDGEDGKRPIDALIQNFYEVYQSLVLAATNPSQAERANANLQLQVVNLRANASRMPKPLARMVNAAVDDFEGDAANTSMAQLNQMLVATVTRPCEQVVANRFPFARNSGRDVPMADFARLFSPNGVIDRFFAQNLAPLADMTGDVWVWKQETRLGRELSNATLKEFQRASKIRDAFFPQGGSMPAVTLTFTPFSLHGEAQMALLDINSQVVQSQQVGSVPYQIDWPGSMASGSVNLSFQPQIPGRQSMINFDGPWALMRLFDAGSVTKKGDNIQARFVVGGRDVAYTIQVGSIDNPFFLPALSEFSCPTGL